MVAGNVASLYMVPEPLYLSKSASYVPGLSRLEVHVSEIVGSALNETPDLICKASELLKRSAAGIILFIIFKNEKIINCL